MLSREERARQFLPFDALNGFYQELKEKEIEYVEIPELSEEQIEEIEQKLNKIRENTKVKITYYCNRSI
ncbi:MAG: YolD-like family protein [Clostridia bacterium]|nr:YolD-like family protein [Clostridia bacterium]